MNENDLAEIARYESFRKWRGERLRNNEPLKVIEFNFQSKKYKAKFSTASQVWNVFYDGICVNDKEVEEYFKINLQPDWSRSLEDFIRINREKIIEKLKGKNMEITANELIEKNLWGKYCELTGTSEWAVNEGLIDGDEKINISSELALKLELI